MPHTLLVTLAIRDANTYEIYRTQMAPILKAHTGRFVVDVIGGDVRKHPAAFEPDRVFLLQFDDKSAADAFFSDPTYLVVKEQYFTPSVAKTHAVVLTS